MSNTSKTFVDSMWLEEKQFTNGGSILKVSMISDKMIEFLQKNKNSKGYVKIVIAKRRELGKNGETHYAYLDIWEPKTQTAQVAPQKIKKLVETKKTEVQEQQGEELI